MDATGGSNGGGGNWDQFAAAFVNREAKAMREAHLALDAKLRHPGVEGGSVVSGGTVQGQLAIAGAVQGRKPKAKSAKELFRKDLLLRWRASGILTKPIPRHGAASWYVVSSLRAPGAPVFSLRGSTFSGAGPNGIAAQAAVSYPSGWGCGGGGLEW